MRALGAIFDSAEAASRAAEELAAHLKLEPSSIRFGRLGARGEPQDGLTLIAGALSDQAVENAMSIIGRHGGRIVADVPAEASSVRPRAPISRSRSLGLNRGPS